MYNEILQALLECIGKHPEGEENKKWFMKLIQDSLEKKTNPETDVDLIYNATIIEDILANILAIDIKTIVKIRMIHKIITTLWIENGWDLSSLNNYILENKPIILDNSPNRHNDHIQQLNITPTTTILEEIPSEEIEMAENIQDTLGKNETHPTYPIKTPIETTNYISYDIIGKDITSVSNYNIRNRKTEVTNPFFITKNKEF